MKCNQLHCQFNCNRRLRSRLNLEVLTLHHYAMNHGCGRCISSIICCGNYFAGGYLPVSVV